MTTTSTSSSLELFSLAIHETLQHNQASHGLRQNDDYKQYHQYCTRRLARLRHAKEVRRDLVHSSAYVSGTKLKRNAYCPRSYAVVTKEKEEEEEQREEEERSGGEADPRPAIHHENFLWVVLINAERAWAHSQELKASQQQQFGGKARQHALRRLKKASKLATEFQELVETVGDARTIQEAKAYASWMRGNYALEVGDYKTACDNFGSAISLCLGLSRSSEGEEQLELRDLFTARVENVLKPLLRYCQYEYRESGGTPPEIPELQHEEENTKQAPSSGGASIQFRNQTLPVENKNLRVLLLKLDALMGSTTSTTTTTDDDKFVALLSTYDDAIAIVTSDLKNYQSMKEGPAVNAKRAEMQSLLGYVTFAKLQLEMKRAEDMVNRLRQESAGSYAEIAHLYDALLQEARVVGTLPGALPDSEEDEFVLEANANVLRLRAWRCYYAGLLYAESTRTAEAMALWKQASLLASRASEEIAACEDMKHGDEHLEGLEKLSVDIRGAMCRLKAQAYLARTEGSSVGTTSSNRSLLLRLDEFDGSRNLVDVAVGDHPAAVQARLL